MISHQVKDRDFVMENGTFVTIQNGACMAQRLNHELKLDKGTWFFDTSKGFPWFEICQKKEVSSRLVDSNTRSILSADDEVTGINSIDVSLDRETRDLTLDFNVSSEYGDVEDSL